MITIPNAQNGKQITQTNFSDVLGTLYASFNLDLLRNRGKFRVGGRMIVGSNTSDVAEINNYPAGYRYFNNGSGNAYYMIAGASNVGYAFTASGLNGSWSKVTTSGAPTTVDSTTSDIETAFGELYVSSSNDGKVYYLNGLNSWSHLLAGSAGYTTMLCYYAGRMYATNLGNKIQSWDSSHTVVSPSNPFALQLGNGEIITWIRAASDRLWIGTINTTGGKGYVYSWDGVSQQTTAAYRLQSAGALSCVIKEDVPYIIDSNGALLKWNGGTFTILTGIYRKKLKPLFNPYYQTNQRFVHPNGMSVVNGKINVALYLTNYDASSGAGTQEDCNPSGIWEFDGEVAFMNPESGTNTLYHKQSFTTTHQSDTITDYGQFRIAGIGALSEIVTAQAPIITNGTFLAGASYYTDMASPTISSAVFFDDSNDTLPKIGYFVTTKLFAGATKTALLDMYQKIHAVHEPFLNPNNPDRIVIKYRKSSDVPVEGNITWTSTTTFTTTLNVSGYHQNDEVEILAGVIGAGQPTHLTSDPVNSSGTYTCTVADAYTSASNQVSYARFSHWTYMGVIKDLIDHDELTIGEPNSYIQLKVYMIWAGANELNEIILVNNEDTEASD